MNRRKFFAFLGAAAAAPVAAKLAPIPSDGVALTSVSHPIASTEYVSYGGKGAVYDAAYVWHTYGVEVGPVVRTWLEATRELEEQCAANLLNESFLTTTSIKLPGPRAEARAAFQRFDERAKSLS